MPPTPPHPPRAPSLGEIRRRRGAREMKTTSDRCRQWWSDLAPISFVDWRTSIEKTRARHFESASCRGRVSIRGRARRDRVNGMNEAGEDRRLADIFTRTARETTVNGRQGRERTRDTILDTKKKETRIAKIEDSAVHRWNPQRGHPRHPRDSRCQMDGSRSGRPARGDQRMIAGWGKSQEMENQSRLDGLQNVGAEVGHRQEKMEVQVRSNACT